MYLIKNIWNLFSLNISLEAIWSSLLTNMVYNNRKKLYQKIENASKISKLYMVKIFFDAGTEISMLNTVTQDQHKKLWRQITTVDFSFLFDPRDATVPNTH